MDQIRLAIVPTLGSNGEKDRRLLRAGQAYSMFLKGESDMVLSYHLSGLSLDYC